MLLVNLLANNITLDGVALKLSKGETAFFTVRLYDEVTKSQYLLKSNEKIIFGVKKQKNISTYKIKKQLSANDEINGAYPFILTDSETDIAAGRYYFDVGVKTSNNYFMRPIKDQILSIVNAVTYKEDIE